MSLTLENITKIFEGKKVIDGFSYSFLSKGIYVITGRSGVGKTTLLRIISGLDKKYSGKVFGGGIGSVSLAFQEYRLFDRLSALDNVVSAISEKYDEKINEAALSLLLRLGFSEREAHLFPAELSGGMKQRVSLARAIIKKTPVLLLDEPTKELDERLRSILYGILKEEAEERLVILVSHNQEDIAHLGASSIVLE